MLKNYFTTAFRNLTKKSGYTFFNVFGLSIGIAACLLIFLIIDFETSFDNFHSKRANIFRVGSKGITEQGVTYSGGSAFPLGPAIRNEIPSASVVARILKQSNETISINSSANQNKKLKSDIYYAEPEIFTVFDFTWLQGNAQATLSQPKQAALTQQTATRFFGDWRTAIGKNIMCGTDKNKIYTITGILKDLPSNTDFPLDIVVSYNTLLNTDVKGRMDDWVSTWNQAYTFVVLPAAVSVSNFNSELASLAKRHKPTEYANDGYVAQPFSEIHFDNRFGNYRNRTISMDIILALKLIALFLLLIASVNFINLATVQAVNRSREVGVRKVLGSNRSQLMFQFFCETGVITVIAATVAVAIAYSVLPLINNILELEISKNFLQNPALLLFLLSIIFVTTILSGFYPAILLSGFNPIKALKTKITSKMAGGLALRRLLVILQFSIAHILVISTIIVVNQMNFFQNKNLGFDKEAIINVSIPNDSLSKTKMDHLKNQLLTNANISKVSFSFSPPAAPGNWQSDFKFDHSTKTSNFMANLKWADAEYFALYNFKFVAGRPYYPSDTVREFVVNENLLYKLGITDPSKAIGKQIDFWDGEVVAKITGVIQDFNSKSLREEVSPVVLGSWKDLYQKINLKIKRGYEKQTLAFIEKAFNQTYPESLFEYSFLDQAIANFYKQENQLSQLYKIFAVIAILISCLGLYGLVSFIASQRTKELGIRKVLGASSKNLVFLLSKEFILLILVAFAVAAPIAYYFMHQWLQGYTYRIGIGIWIFCLAIIGSLLVAAVTVGYKALRAAMSSPVTNLRTE